MANRAFLWADAPLAEGGVWGERVCFWPEALGAAGPGPGGGGAAAEADRVVEVLGVAGAPAGTCLMTGARGRLEGGGCRQRLTVTWAPKQKKCLAAMREGAMVPSGSSNVMTSEDDDPGWNRRGGLTHEGN